MFRVTASRKCPGCSSSSSSPSSSSPSSRLLLLLPDSPKPNPCSHRGCAGSQPSTAHPPRPAPSPQPGGIFLRPHRIRSWLAETCGRSSLLPTFRLFALLSSPELCFPLTMSVRVNKPPGEGDQESLDSGKKRRPSGSAGLEAGQRPFWMSLTGSTLGFDFERQ